MQPAPVRVSANDHLPRVSRQSRPSANDKGDNEMIPGALHRSPGIYFKAEKNPRVTSARRPSMKILRPVITSNGIPNFRIRPVGSYSTSGMEKKGKKE